MALHSATVEVVWNARRKGKEERQRENGRIKLGVQSNKGIRRVIILKKTGEKFSWRNDAFVNIFRRRILNISFIKDKKKSRNNKKKYKRMYNTNRQHSFVKFFNK